LAKDPKVASLALYEAGDIADLDLGDRDLAIRFFSLSLQKNGQNQESLQRLDQIRSGQVSTSKASAPGTTQPKGRFAKTIVGFQAAQMSPSVAQMMAKSDVKQSLQKPQADSSNQATQSEPGPQPPPLRIAPVIPVTTSAEIPDAGSGVDSFPVQAPTEMEPSMPTNIAAPDVAQTVDEYSVDPGDDIPDPSTPFSTQQRAQGGEPPPLLDADALRTATESATSSSIADGPAGVYSSSPEMYPVAEPSEARLSEPIISQQKTTSIIPYLIGAVVLGVVLTGVWLLGFRSTDSDTSSLLKQANLSQKPALDQKSVDKTTELSQPEQSAVADTETTAHIESQKQKGAEDEKTAQAEQPSEPRVTASKEKEDNPQPKVDGEIAFGSVSVVEELAHLRGGRMDKQQFLAAVEKRLPDIESCYLKTLERKSSLKGRLVYAWTIKSSGRGSSVKKLRGTIKDSYMSNCIASVIRGTGYPPAKGGSVRATLPFVFKK